MDRNFFIALGLSFLLYLGYTYFFPSQKSQPAPQQTIEETQTAAQNTQTTAVNVGSPVVTKTQAAKTEEKESLYTVETKHADVVFTSKGAAIKDFIYNDIVEPVNLTPYGTEGYFATLPDVNFTKVSDSASDITFKAVLSDGLEMQKSYILNREGGINSLKIKLINKSKENYDISKFFLTLGPGLATVKSETGENEANWRAVCSVQEENRKNPTVNKITEKTVKTPAKLEAECHNWKWAGIDNRYFLAAVIPQNWETTSSQLSFAKYFTHNKDSFFGLFGKKAVEGPKLDISLPSHIAAKSTVDLDMQFYFGPKDHDFLLTLPYDLNRSIQFGFFGQFGKWARALLQWLYGITHNYGWAIILMTFLIQTALFPLTYKQLKSSLVMQKIQPEMKRLQEKYKSDPQAQQRELMALYKKYGANPFTGCLPLFIQLPIFLALFNALRTSWELHGAPFIWWIQDLSAKDPFYVLPIAMGAMMFVQQKMTMPDMAKDNPSMAMMKWMPLFMTVIFLNFPAGLTLYWFVSNCISFVINIVLKRKLAKAF